MNLTDDLGRSHSFSRLPQRIISLAPAVAENLFAIGAGKLLVGVTTADDYPAEVKRLPRVGDFGTPAYERIRALRADLAIVEIARVDRATVENAQQRLKVPIFVQMSRRYTDIPRHLRQLGQLTGRLTAAVQQANKLEQTRARVEKRVKGKPQTTVFVEVSASPLYAAGPGSFVDDLIGIAGGVNVVKGENPYPPYSREALLVANPEHYIIAVGGDMGGSDVAVTLPPPLHRLRAAKSGNIHRIPSDFLFRPTPRLALGLQALEKALWD